jgi:hypothetical protein
MTQFDPQAYEALFEQFKRVHPEYSEEPTYFPTAYVLCAFQAWADGALKAAGDGGVAELMRTVFQAENPEFAGDLRTKFEQEEEADELLPVTRRLLSGGTE